MGYFAKIVNGFIYYKSFTQNIENIYRKYLSQNAPSQLFLKSLNTPLHCKVVLKRFGLIFETKYSRLSSTIFTWSVFEYFVWKQSSEQQGKSKGHLYLSLRPPSSPLTHTEQSAWQYTVSFYQIPFYKNHEAQNHQKIKNLLRIMLRLKVSNLIRT